MSAPTPMYERQTRVRMLVDVYGWDGLAEALRPEQLVRMLQAAHEDRGNLLAAINREGLLDD